MQTPETPSSSAKELEAIAPSVMHTAGAAIFQVLLVIATTSALARSLGPSVKGAYDLCIATGQMLYTLFSLSLPSGITYIVASQRADTRALMRFGAFWAIALTLASYLTLLLSSALGFRHALVPVDLGTSGAVAVSISVGVLGLGAWFRSILVGLRRFVQANCGDISRNTVALLLTLAILSNSPTDHRDACVAILLVASFLAGLIGTAVYVRNIRAHQRKPSRLMVREVALYCLPAFSGDVLQFINYRFGLLIVSSWVGLAGVGILQSATFVAQALWLLPQAVAAITFPVTANGRAEHQDLSAVNAKCARVVLWVSTLCSMLMVLIAPVLIPILFSKTFSEATPVLLILIPGTVAFCPAKVLASHLAGIGAPQWNFRGALLGALVTVTGSVVLVPKFGIRGAALACTMSHLCNSAVILRGFQRNAGLSISEIAAPRFSDVLELRHVLARLLRPEPKYV